MGVMALFIILVCVILLPREKKRGAR